MLDTSIGDVLTGAKAVGGGGIRLHKEKVGGQTGVTVTLTRFL